MHGHTIIEKYVSQDKNNQTEIKVGYLVDALIYLQYDNPLTPGYIRQQSLENFYRYDFTPDKSYGESGLEFIDMNVQAIDKQLRDGLKGKEVQFLKDGQLVKSKVFIYYDNNQEAYPNIIHFTKKSFWQKFLGLFSKPEDDNSLKIKEIDLSTIFIRLK